MSEYPGTGNDGRIREIARETVEAYLRDVIASEIRQMIRELAPQEIEILRDRICDIARDEIRESLAGELLDSASHGEYIPSGNIHFVPVPPSDQDSVSVSMSRVDWCYVQLSLAVDPAARAHQSRIIALALRQEI